MCGADGSCLGGLVPKPLKLVPQQRLRTFAGMFSSRNDRVEGILGNGRKETLVFSSFIIKVDDSTLTVNNRTNGNKLQYENKKHGDEREHWFPW